MSQTIYCISGLGADHRIFADLAVPGVRLEAVPWLIPAKGESLRQYALRMKPHPAGKHPVLMGVSFGGMMAIEMACTYPQSTVILLSSVATRKQLPFWMKAAGRMRLNNLFHPASGGGPGFIEKYLLGVETAEDAQLVREFKASSNPEYITWAIDQIINWRNQWVPSNFYHIHGTKDRMFPLRKVRATHVVNGGGHFMVKNRAAEVSAMLADIVGKLGPVLGAEG